MVFLDTNVLLYAGSKSPKDARKRRAAEEIIRTEDLAISTQVVQEYIANALGKKELGLTEAGLDAALESFGLITVLPVTLDLIRQAQRLRRRFQLSPWDASILAAAQELGCATLYSEDFNAGQDYGGVRAVNPFA